MARLGGWLGVMDGGGWVLKRIPVDDTSNILLGEGGRGRVLVCITLCAHAFVCTCKYVCVRIRGLRFASGSRRPLRSREEEYS